MADIAELLEPTTEPSGTITAVKQTQPDAPIVGAPAPTAPDATTPQTPTAPTPGKTWLSTETKANMWFWKEMALGLLWVIFILWQIFKKKKAA